MSLEGGRNNLYWWPKSPPFSKKDQLKLLGYIALYAAILGIGIWMLV